MNGLNNPLVIGIGFAHGSDCPMLGHTCFLEVATPQTAVISRPDLGFGLASAMGIGMMMRISYRGVAVASKDKGGKSEKKRPQKNLKEKRADKKQKKAK